MNRLRSFVDFFGLKRDLVILLFATLAIGTGEELWMRFVPKYLQALGAALFVIGLFDALRTLLGALYAYPGGVLVDLWGHRRAFIAFNLFSIIGYALVLLIPHWGAVIAGMFLFLSWTCFSLPATFSLIAATLAADRYSMGVGVQATIKRLPIIVAPFLGGVLIDRFGIVTGVRIGLAMSILLSGVTIFMQRRLSEEPSRTRSSDDSWSFWRSFAGFNAPLRRLLLSDILIRFCERIPFAWVVIYSMDYIGVSAKQIGLLTSVEVVAAILIIIPASHFADKFGREPFVIATFVIFTLFPVSLWLAGTFPMLIVAFAIRGLKEFGDTSRKALIIEYCEPLRRGQMIGTYYLIRDLLVSTGALAGVLLWKLGPAINFVSATILGAAGTIFYICTLDRRYSPTLET